MFAVECGGRLGSFPRVVTECYGLFPLPRVRRVNLGLYVMEDVCSLWKNKQSEVFASDPGF